MNHGLTCPGLDDLGHEPHDIAKLEDLTVDHIVTLANGGELLDPTNCRVLCRAFNTARRS